MLSYDGDRNPGPPFPVNGVLPGGKEKLLPLLDPCSDGILSLIDGGLGLYFLWYFKL